MYYKITESNRSKIDILAPYGVHGNVEIKWLATKDYHPEWNYEGAEAEFVTGVQLAATLSVPLWIDHAADTDDYLCYLVGAFRLTNLSL